MTFVEYKTRPKSGKTADLGQARLPDDQPYSHCFTEKDLQLAASKIIEALTRKVGKKDLPSLLQKLGPQEAFNGMAAVLGKELKRFDSANRDR